MLDIILSSGITTLHRANRNLCSRELTFEHEISLMEGNKEGGGTVAW